MSLSCEPFHQRYFITFVQFNYCVFAFYIEDGTECCSTGKQRCERNSPSKLQFLSQLLITIVYMLPVLNRFLAFVPTFPLNERAAGVFAPCERKSDVQPNKIYILSLSKEVYYSEFPRSIVPNYRTKLWRYISRSLV